MLSKIRHRSLYKRKSFRISSRSFAVQFQRKQTKDEYPIIPQFWTGKNAVPESSFAIDCQQLFPRLASLADICVPGPLCEITNDGTTRRSVVNTNTNEGELLSNTMRQIYDEHGMVLLKNTGLTSGDHMKAFILLVTENSIVYEGGANPRSAIPEQNLYDTGAPLVAHIHFHHEMAYVKETVANLGFGCISNTNQNKGHTFLSKNIGAHDMIMNSRIGLGEKLKDKGICYIRKLPDRKFFLDHPEKTNANMVYNFWQHSFMTEDPDEAAEIARTKKDLEVEWEDSPIFGRYMVTKHYTDAFEYCPYTDRNLLFSSLADDHIWFDTWPGVMDLPVDDRPLQLTFGDDVPFTHQEKEEYVFAYDAFGTRIPWQVGDVGVVCNVRTAHGRPSIFLEKGERRELGVVLGSVMEKKGVLPDKW